MESLGRILIEHTDSIMERWLAIVREESLGRRGLSEVALKDALPMQLRVVGEALQTGSEKADELWTSDPSRLDPEDRVLQQVPIEEVVAEYSYAVDAIRRWVHERGIDIPFEDFSFVHTALFELAAESVRRYAAYQDRRLEELRENDRRMNNFLSLLSHELRNPLTPIRYSLHLLGRDPLGSTQARRAYSVIHRQVDHLARIVDDLLDITRVVRGKIRLQCERLDLVDVVQKTLEDHGSVLDSVHVEVDVPEEPVWIDGDLTRMSQVVGNLLVNAAKFTPPQDGQITVSLVATEERAVLTVTDTGIGMTHETLERLFEPFSQADKSLDRSEGGLGLGLALVKGLVRMHGGHVWADSEGPGHGSSFTIALPLDQRALRPETPPRLEQERGTRKVLIIEDNTDSADTLAEVLTLAGHRVDVAYDGPTAIAKAREFQPDVVLCDIGLPAMDGFAVASALRNDPKTARSLLVALSGYAQAPDRSRALEAGFDEHLAKPPDIATLERLLAHARAGRRE
jgi:signal transduction histidine kinase/ActR/RegA family two-component response regulator